MHAVTWVRRLLRGTAVFVRADADGAPVKGPDGRVDVIYKLEPAAKIYRAAAGNLTATAELEREAPVPDDRGPGAGGSRAGADRAGTPARAPVDRKDAVIVYTDGACTGNPGPMGVGVVVLADGQRQELSEYLGHGTNNIAELTAIERGLEMVERLGEAQLARPVLVHSDSAYALGLLGKGWKAKANQELVERLRARARRFPRLELVKVAGHAGIPENERCDQLAREAVVKGLR
jgi:ribonuclease HI